MNRSPPLAHEQLTRRIIGAFFDVYHVLGAGFLEVVYQEALAIVFEEACLRVEREPRLSVHFRD